METIDRYELKLKLGVGGTSTVYLAYDHTTNRDVAVKLLRDNGDDAVRMRFRREIEMLQALDHPNIVPILDAGETENSVYLVMPYMAGGSLRQKMGQRPLPFSQTITIIQRIAEALDYAHERNIIHRDIKPHNILLNEQGAVCLSDFGVARIIDSDNPAQTVTMIGTPEYMAPEQVLEGGLSAQTDIYQLGVLLFEMMTGQRPFTGTTHSIMTQHLQEVVPSAEALNDRLPLGVDGIVRRAMAKRPLDRYNTAKQLVQALVALSAPQTEETGYTQTIVLDPELLIVPDEMLATNATPILAIPEPENGTSTEPEMASTETLSATTGRTKRRSWAWIVALCLLLGTLGVSAFTFLPNGGGDGNGNGNGNGGGGRNRQGQVDQPAEDVVQAPEAEQTTVLGVVDAIFDGGEDGGNPPPPPRNDNNPPPPRNGGNRGNNPPPPPRNNN